MEHYFKRIIPINEMAKRKPPINAFQAGDLVKMKPVDLWRPLASDGWRNKWRLDMYAPSPDRDVVLFRVDFIRPSISKRNGEGVYILHELNAEGSPIGTIEAWDGVLDPKDLDRSSFNKYEFELDGEIITFEAR